MELTLLTVCSDTMMWLILHERGVVCFQLLSVHIEIPGDL